MRPNLLDGDTVVVAPAAASNLRRGDVVLTPGEVGLRMHRVALIDVAKGQVITRGDSGQENDAPAQQVLGKVIAAGRDGKVSRMAGTQSRLRHSLCLLLHRVKLSSLRRFKQFRSLGTLLALLVTFVALIGAAPASAQSLNITNSGSPANVLPGGTITYTQVLTNTSGITVTPNVTVTQTVPGGTTLVSVTASGSGTWSCPGTGATCTDTANYPSGSTTTFTVTVTVNSGGNAATVLTETVTAKGNNTGNATGSANVTLTADLSLTQTVSPSQVAPGANFAYSEVVTNNSTDTVATGTITVSMAVPANTAYQSGTGTNWSCVSSAGTITCTYNSSLGSGATASTLTITLQVVANTTSGTVITNSASVADSGFTDPNQSNNTATSSVTVQPADLALAQTVSPSEVAPGANYVYSEVVTNNGPTAVGTGTIALSTTTPANTNYQSYAGTNWTCTTPAVGGTGAITCTYNSTLASNSSASTLTLTLQVNAAATVGTIITNSATVSDAAFTDPNLSNNTSTASITVEPSGDADLQLIQTASASAVAAGSNVVYTETVSDNGPTATTANTITVYMQTPPNTSYQSNSGTNWTCGTHPATNGTGPVICTYTAALGSGSTANALTVTFQVTAGTAAGTTIQSSATVTNSTFVDPMPSNNTSITSIVVEPATSADLALSMFVAPTPVFVSSAFSYTIQIQNLGQAAAAVSSNVLSDTLPSGLTNVSVSASSGWSCSGTATVTCSITSAMAAGTAATITISATSPSTAQTLTNTAAVNLTGDPNAANNSATAYTVVQPIACATPGRDGAVGSITGIVNTYYPPANQGTLPSASTSVALGTPQGASATVTAGDLFLIIQMQGAAINNTNTSSYGHGVPGDPGAGSTNVGGSGLFEFVTATGFTAGTPNTLTFTGTGPTGGLLNTYSYVPTGLSLGTATAASWAGNVASFTFPHPLPTSVAAGSVLTTTGFAPAGYNLTATITTANSATGVVTVALTTNPGAATTFGNGAATAYLGSATAASWAANVASFTFPTPLPASVVPNSVLTTKGFTPAGYNVTEAPILSVNTTTGVVTVALATNPGAETALGAGSAAVQGQQTYQVIRVPQYLSASLSSSLAPLAWPGGTAGVYVGGVLAIDVSSQLTLGGTVALDGLGFRGAGGITLRGTTATVADTDYVTNSPASLPNVSGGDAPANSGTNASKGEGIAGSPHWVVPSLFSASGFSTSSTAVSTGQAVVEGLLGGSFARGAPGNAGGGGTDGDPANNDYNSGGGAGGNGGAGGQGGYGWDSMAATNTTDGGFGGAIFPASTSALVMGGGGGAGTTNNGSYYISAGSNGADCGNTCTGIYSSGGNGGGIAIIHAGSVSGTGTITANGESTLNTLNDSTGGGGAGGSILIYANSGGLAGLTVNAIGGSGGSAWSNTGPGTPFPGNRHGPGGGGGGGVILLTAAPASASVASGASGYTTTVQDSYGATPGSAGQLLSNLVITETPGTQSGAYCGSADLSVTNSASPAVVLPGANITYTQTVTNNGPLDAVNAVFSESIPANTTFQSINTVSGWTCVTPAVGGTGTITCTNPDFLNSGSVTFNPVVQVVGGTLAGTQIVDVDNVTSGTNDPNLANNTATAVTTVGAANQADLAVTNTASAPTVLAGSNFTMTAVVSNNGPAAATGVVFTEDIPANTTLGAAFAPPSGWSCNTIAVGGTGTLTCTDSSFAALATSTFTVVLNVNSGTASGTVISDTANIASPTPDPNTGNNSATATTVVATAGQADLAVASSGLPNPVTPGNNITYTQTVTNNGPTAITASGTTSVTFTDAIPANTTLASTFTPPSGWSCNSIAVGATGTFTCTLNSGQTLAVNAVVSFPLVVKVNAGTASGTIITNSPSIASSVSDPNSANNTATVNTLVASPSQADVTITKTASPEPVDQNTILTYTIQVTNNGPAIAQGVTVTDPIPTQVTYSSSSTSQGTCSYASSTVTCNIGNLGVGSVAVITINVTATVFGSSSVLCNGVAYNSCNTATVSTTTSNPNPNTSSSAGSTIQAPTAVDLASFRAILQLDGSVRLEWRTHEESRNLGFHIYRDDASGRHRLDASLIAGSALLLRGSKPQHAAKSYGWFDLRPSPDSAYWVEDVDINGTRTLHGPVYPEEASAGQVSSPALAQSAEALSVSPTLGELRSAVLSASVGPRPLATPRPVFPTPPPTVPRFNVADHVAVQISVDQEGWYHIPFAQLFSAGLDPNTDLRTLHLYAEGIEQPLLLVGHSSGLPSPSDAIEFYGVGIDTPFSETRIYWLIRESSFGKHIFPSPAAPSGGIVPSSFPFTVIRQDRTVYFGSLLNGENNDNFFGAVITSDPVDQTLTVAHRDTSSSLPLTLDLTLQGATDQQQHSISIQFNGSNVGTFDFYGQILATQSFEVDPSLVQDGTNTVTLSALNGDNDVSVVQSIQLHYLHTYVADADWLRATASAGSELHITGFVNSHIRVFDVTDSLNVSQLNGTIAPDSGAYGISVSLPNGTPYERTLIALSDATLSSPQALTFHTPTFLDDQHAGADIVIITHPDFAAHLTPLVRVRQSQGYQVSVVTTTQLFDEFNYGERSPFALRAFLQEAATLWKRKPQAILLVGDASLDPRNYLGFGDFDFVPTRMIETAAFKTASDDWFTDFLQNGYATIPTGRLPVRTAADIDLVVSKIVGYEQGHSSGPWSSQALLIADQNVDANFTSAVVSEVAILPKSLQSSQILADGLDPSLVRSQILGALNNGALLVDYNGHGAEQQWSFSDLFNNNDASALTNGGQLPVYLISDCLNGLFQDVYAESLAESLLLAPNGGAVAVWASSGFTDQAPQVSMNLAFLQGLAAHPNQSIGRLALNAKAVTTDNDVRRTWILFGDPAMKFHFGAVSSASASGSDTAPPATGTHHGCSPLAACAKEKE